VEGVPSGELYTVVLSRGPKLLSPPGVLVAAGDRSSFWLSPGWLRYQLATAFCLSAREAYLSTSLALACVFLRLGVGMRHSMEKAVQLVQGTPRLAASHRTCRTVTFGSFGGASRVSRTHFPGVASWRRGG
jgi:hypothetical protein